MALLDFNNDTVFETRYNYFHADESDIKFRNKTLTLMDHVDKFG